MKPALLDVAIVGGGLCGLALAHSLQARGCDWRLFEARGRLGGRVLSAKDAEGRVVDLGATWFWPATQPAISRLVADLGLADVEQHDDGRVLHLADPNRAAETVALTAQLQPAADASLPATPGAVHGGARRVAGGMGALVEALARPLPGTRLRLGQRLKAVLDHGDFIELQLSDGAASCSVHARRLVLALPPRVAEASLQFTPALAPELRAALRATPTWMATAAKAGFTYRQAFWRAAGHTGNAWVSHAQAMLAEVFDACAPAAGGGGETAALAGFAALGSAQRASFSRGRELLLASQLEQLFGPEATDPGLLRASFWQDWATEGETCSPADIADEAQPAAGHPHYGEPLLAQPHWQGRLHFGGSETARHGGGYLEGALGAAGRLRSQLLGGSLARLRPREAANEAGKESAKEAANETVSESGNETTSGDADEISSEAGNDAFDDALDDGLNEAGSKAAASDAAATATTTTTTTTATPPTDRRCGAGPDSAADHPALLARFEAWLAAERGQAMGRYRERLHEALSKQDDERLTQRALLAVLQALHGAALRQIEEWSPAVAEPAAAAALASRLQQGLDGLADELLVEALIHNLGSCALSNFPLEHRPGGAYVRAIRQQLLAAGQDFALALRQQWLARAGQAA